MLELKDGPCQGTYMCKRAPVFLRAVKGKDNAGNTDVLDLIEDTPTSGEAVYIYQLEGEAFDVHLNFGGGRGGWYQAGTYHYLPDVDGEKLRGNQAWQEWVLSQDSHKPTFTQLDEKHVKDMWRSGELMMRDQYPEAK